MHEIALALYSRCLFATAVDEKMGQTFLKSKSKTEVEEK